MNLIDNVIRLLAKGDEQDRLIRENNDHALTGNWKHYRELHVMPDWLLIYYIEDNILVLTLSRTGTHGDLFGK